MKTSQHITKKTSPATAATTRNNGKNDATKTNADASDPFFAEPFDPVQEGREQGFEVIRHLLVWMADAPTLEKRGLRATIALHCLRPDLVDGMTLENIGDEFGCTRQSVHVIARDFRKNMNLEQ
jgi:hypothetical protein